MFLFGMAWLFALIVIGSLGVFLYNLNSRVNTMEKNYELNSIESLRKMVVDLQATVAKLIQK